MHTLAKLDQFTNMLLFSLWQEAEVYGQRNSLRPSSTLTDFLYRFLAALHQVEFGSVGLRQSVWTAAGIGLQVQKL